jgi:hypothetical protein
VHESRATSWKEHALAWRPRPATTQEDPALRAEFLLDRTDDPEEPLYVFADLSGHPFCIFVA